MPTEHFTQMYSTFKGIGRSLSLVNMHKVLT